MPIFTIKFDQEKTDLLLSMMEGLEARGLDMGPALSEVANVFLASQEALFSGANDWAPLTAGTVEAKERRGFPHMMVKSGLLQRSLTRREGPPGASTVSTNTFALMGTHAKIAHIQARGTAERYQKTTGRYTGKVTGRSMSFVGAVQIATYYEILESWLVNGTVYPAAPEGIAAVGIVDLSGFDMGI